MTTRNDEKERRINEEINEQLEYERRRELMLLEDEDNDEFDLTELERDELLRKVTELCDIIGGEDAYNRFTHEELVEMLKEMSDSHEELTTIKECKDAQESYELFNPSSIL